MNWHNYIDCNICNNAIIDELAKQLIMGQSSIRYVLLQNIIMQDYTIIRALLFISSTRPNPGDVAE